MNDPGRPTVPEIRPAVFPLPPEDLAKLFDFLRREWSMFIPEVLHLILGAENAHHLLPRGVREPTHEMMQDLLRRLEGEDFQAIREVLRELAGQHLRQLAERQLDFLESLPGKDWKHPVEVLSRPWHLEGILALCEERAHEGTKKQRNRRLKISKKLKAAHEIEKRAASRRRNLSDDVEAMVDKVLSRADRRDEEKAGTE